MNTLAWLDRLTAIDTVSRHSNLGLIETVRDALKRHGLDPWLNRVAHAFLIGEATERFAAWLGERKVPFSCCGTLDVAVADAAAMAWNDGFNGATVLLSPACASFDQFVNFERRGEAFAELVRDLAPEGIG